MEKAANSFFNAKAIESQGNTEQESTIKQIFKNRDALRTIVCLILIKFCYFASFHGVLGSCERLGMSPGMGIFLIGLSEFVGFNSSQLFVQKFKRKNLLIGANMIRAGIGLLTIFPFVQESPELCGLVIFTSFVVGTFNFSAISML